MTHRTPARNGAGEEGRLVSPQQPGFKIQIFFFFLKIRNKRKAEKVTKSTIQT